MKNVIYIFLFILQASNERLQLSKTKFTKTYVDNKHFGGKEQLLSIVIRRLGNEYFHRKAHIDFH